MSERPHASQGECSRRKTRRWTFALFVISIAVTGAWLADWKWPSDPQSGTEFSGTMTASAGLSRQFRVATFNIHGGRGLDGKLDLERTARCLSQSDIAGLNEVWQNSYGGKRNQAERLGELLQMQALFAPTETGWTGPLFGQGVLSRYQVQTWQVTPFPRNVGNGYRNYVECQFPFQEGIELNGKPAVLTLLVTHLDRRADRETQLKTIIQHFLELPPPVILMGDLNTKRTDPQIQELAKQPDVIDCFGQFAKEPLVSKRIDWIFARGLQCLDANLEANDASDHPWGWAKFQLSSRLRRSPEGQNPTN